MCVCARVRARVCVHRHGCGKQVVGNILWKDTKKLPRVATRNRDLYFSLKMQRTYNMCGFCVHLPVASTLLARPRASDAVKAQRPVRLPPPPPHLLESRCLVLRPAWCCWDLLAVSQPTARDKLKTKNYFCWSFHVFWCVLTPENKKTLECDDYSFFSFYDNTKCMFL